MNDAPLDLQSMVVALADEGVEYIVVGSVAAAVWTDEPAGSFGDFDVVPDPRAENLARLARVLERGEAKPVHRPDWKRSLTPDQIRVWRPEPATVEQLDHQMRTRWGLLDVVPAVAGRFDDLVVRAANVSAWGRAVRIARPEDLIATLRPDTAYKHVARKAALERSLERSDSIRERRTLETLAARAFKEMKDHG